VPAFGQPPRRGETRRPRPENEGVRLSRRRRRGRCSRPGRR
jgi:hypothetical protein